MMTSRRIASGQAIAGNTWLYIGCRPGPVNSSRLWTSAAHFGAPFNNTLANAATAAVRSIIGSSTNQQQPQNIMSINHRRWYPINNSHRIVLYRSPSSVHWTVTMLQHILPVIHPYSQMNCVLEVTILSDGQRNLFKAPGIDQGAALIRRPSEKRVQIAQANFISYRNDFINTV